MPDLSAYIDFSVELVYAAGSDEIRLTDTGTYPLLDIADVKGKFDVTLPDGITEQGSINLPDIEWDSNTSSFNVAVKDLRRNARNQPQCGTYTIKYTIWHPDYAPTVLTKTFDLNLTLPQPVITPDFDVFTPDLKATDTAAYQIPNFTLTAGTPNWDATVGNVGTLQFIGSPFDLAINGDYYDAVYVIDLLRTLQYTSTQWPWLQITHTGTASKTVTANTPPSTCDLLDWLNEIRLRADAAANNCTNRKETEDAYQQAAALFFLILQNLLAGNTDNISEWVQQFSNIYFQQVGNYVNTNQPILAYQLCYSAGGGGQILTGPGVPSNTLGANGDLFISTSAPNSFYRKIGGVWVLQGQLQGSPGVPGAPGFSANALISGGSVVWQSGYSYIVSLATYRIANSIYTSLETAISLSPADATLDRFDVIAVNDDSQVIVIEGTPAADPVVPEVDPSTQLSLTIVLVRAASTQPDDVVTDSIYINNTEWTTARQGNAITLASTVDPRSAPNHIQVASGGIGNWFQFTGPSAIDLATRTNLVFFFKPVGIGIGGNRSISLQWYNNNSLVGSPVLITNGDFGINFGAFGAYQQIVVPTSLFNAQGNPVNRIRFTLGGSGLGTTFNFLVDDVILQGGVNLVPIVNDKHLRTGAGAPSNSLGLDGDTYLDTNDPARLFEKVSGAWALRYAYGATDIADFIVGPGEPMEQDDTIFQNNLLYKKPLVFIDGLLLTYNVVNDRRYVSFDANTKTITIHNGGVNEGENVRVII